MSTTDHDDAIDPHGESSRPLDLRTWRDLLAYTRPYARERNWLIITAIVLGGLESAYPLVTRRVIDDLSDPERQVHPVLYAALYFGLVLAIAVLVWVFIRLAGKIRTGVAHDVRRSAFVNLQRLSFSFYDQRPIGWLMSRMTSDCERLSNILAWGVLDIVWGTTLLVGITTAMLLLNWQLALLVLSVLPVLLVLSLFFQRRILRTARQTRRWNSQLTASYNEGAMGVKTTKVFAREGAAADEFRVLSTGMYESSVRNAVLAALYLPIVTTVGAVAVAVALQRGGLLVAGGALSLGTMVAFMSYSARFFEPLQQMAHWFSEMQMAQASAERVLGVVHARPQIEDSAELRARIEATAEDQDEAVAEDQDEAVAEDQDEAVAEDGGLARIARIEFRGVEFSYLPDEPVLRGIDLEVQAGQTVALVGSTGGGKTTLVSLLCRFYEPTAGAILLDGVDQRQRGLHWLQSQIGMVLQAPQLFRGTVRENVRHGRPGAPDAAVEGAARAAGLMDVIGSLQHGLDTEVGEAGQRLSSGVRQLVSLARALLKDPQILILDEATSSVDSETEQRVQQALETLLHGRTAFVIAHRLSTIRSADRILVVEAGRIVEAGDHEQLLARRGRYAVLWAQQSLRASTLESDGPD